MAAGRRVLLLEAEESVGGRVRTTITEDGYRLDRGFQVLFSAYPALRRQVPLAALQPKYFEAGVELMTEGRALVLGHPIFDPGSIPGTLRSGAMSPSDVASLLANVASAIHLGDQPLPDSGVSMREALAHAGASDRFIERVIGPLFRGISLDRSLSSDSSFWRLVLRSLTFGRVFLPAYGIGQLTQVLASRLPRTSVRLNTHVSAVVIERDHVTGVVAGGELWRAESVVVATEAPVAQQLTGVPLPGGERSCTTAYFVSDAPVSDSKRLMVHAEQSLVNHVVQLTNISSSYAPRGKHLLSATSLGVAAGDDSAVAGAMLQDMETWLPGIKRVDPKPLAVVRVPYAQFEQGPGIYGRLPGSVTEVGGLHLAGEYLHSSSVQGAIRGGELAAETILRSPSRL
jgi:phytoene dehydrogenase-like protein